MSLADELLASIPEDYTTVNNMAEEALRKKANAIELEVSGEVLFVDNSADAYLLGLNLFGKTMQASEPTPDNPQDLVSIGTAGAIGVTVAGKNLLAPNIRTATINGVTFTIDNDGVIVVDGTATGDSFFKIGSDFTLAPGEKYVLSGCPDGGAFNAHMLYIHHSDSNTDVYNQGGETTFTAKSGKYNAIVVVYKGATVSKLTFCPMIRTISFENGDYEPYSGRTVELDYTLPGIPVTSGGNYTDENDQQWICDEIDFERGVYVQNIASYAVTGAEEWTISGVQASTDGHTRFDYIVSGDHARCFDCLCSHVQFRGANPSTGMSAWVNNAINLGYRLQLPYGTVEELTVFLVEQYEAGTPVTFCYALLNPIETPLTDEEIAAFKALRTNYPNTTILNDAGAWMNVKYNADTKSYVDNPKTLRLTDTSTGVVYELKIVDGSLTVVPV